MIKPQKGEKQSCTVGTWQGQTRQAECVVPWEHGVGSSSSREGGVGTQGLINYKDSETKFRLCWCLTQFIYTGQKKDTVFILLIFTYFLRKWESNKLNYSDTKCKCRRYWCFIEFIDWRNSQSCWYFRPSFVDYCPSNPFSYSPPPHT